AEAQMAAGLRSDLGGRDAAVLPSAAVQSFLRRPPRRLVRAEPPRRGFCRDLRGVADARTRLAAAVQGLEGAAETRIRRGTDGLDRGPAAAAPGGVPHRRIRLPEPEVEDVLRPEAK